MSTYIHCRLSIIIGLLLSAGAGFAQSNADATLVTGYNHAVLNSAYTADSKICSSLLAVNDNNHSLITKTIHGKKYVQAVSWKATVSYFPRNPDSLWNTGPWDNWVTIAPELKQKVTNIDSTHIDLRLKQLLGLPPGSSYGYFVELWVQPSDLLRPCPDKEINDNTCGLSFPPDADSTHIAWMNSQRVSRFFVSDTAARYPWTQLGYTYDWSDDNPCHVGCSEFVLRKNSKVYVNRIVTTNEYLYR